MKLDKKLIGKILKVKFYDHAEGGADVETLECTVVGFLEKVTKREIKMSSWISSDDTDPANKTSFALLRSTIISVRKLT